MKVGVCEATELKKRSEELGIPFADLLWGYAVEDMMLRISTCAYRKVLWLMSLPLLGAEAYRQRAKKRIRFFYQKDAEPSSEKLRPGQKLSIPMGEHIRDSIFAEENEQNIQWEGTVIALSGGVGLDMTAHYFDMTVPFNIEIYSFGAVSQIPGTREEELIALGGKKISYLVYSPESELSYDLFAIIDKLELIGSMGSYYDAYRLLCTQSLSGRYVLEELSMLTAAFPKMRRHQRLAQLESYRNYAYMRKRWDQYLHSHNLGPVTWENAIGRILTFLTPIWKSLCNNEIFFDDWMPELGRFLG